MADSVFIAITHWEEEVRVFQRRPDIASILVALVAFAALLVMTYPTAAAWNTQYGQSKIVDDYEAQVDAASPAAAIQLAEAHAYNEALTMGASYEAGANIPTSEAESASAYDYERLLTVGGGLMARLRIPSIDLDLPVYHGTAEETLLQGVGHLKGTSLPVGGVNTHSVLAAHRGLADAKMFTDLDKVEVGDHFTIEVLGEILEYEVRATRVVDPDANELLELVEGEDLITLVTCTPLGINSHRILVTGTRVNPASPQAERSLGSKSELPGFPWFFIWLGAGLLGSVWLAFALGKKPGQSARPDPASRPGPSPQADLASRPETGIQDSPETAASP
ncbi:class C sortase [Schaalia hyovaginalis]|nr:class C sortase [Schaalia hyovaginalis]